MRKPLPFLVMLVLSVTGLLGLLPASASAAPTTTRVRAVEPVSFGAAPGSVLHPGDDLALGGSGPALLKTVYGGDDQGAFMVTLPTTLYIQPVGHQPGDEASLDITVSPQCDGCAPATADYTVEATPSPPVFTVATAPTTFHPVIDGYDDTFGVAVYSLFRGTLTLTLRQGHRVVSTGRASINDTLVTVRLPKGTPLGRYTWQVTMTAPNDPPTTTKPKGVTALGGRLAPTRATRVGGPAANVAHFSQLPNTPCSRPVDRRGTVVLDNDRKHPCYEPAEALFVTPALTHVAKISAATLTITTDGGPGVVEFDNASENHDRFYSLHGKVTVIHLHLTDAPQPGFAVPFVVHVKQDHDVTLDRLTVDYRYQTLVP